MDRRKAFSLAFSAGLGAAFGLFSWLSIERFFRLQAAEQVDQLLAIVLVGLGIVKFIEPLIDRLRVRLIGEGDRQELRARQARRVRLVAFLVVVVASLSHGFLSSLIDSDPSGALGVVLAAILIAGGTTYAWCRGAYHQPRTAAMQGAITGFFVSAAMFWVNFVAFHGNIPPFGPMSVTGGEAFMLEYAAPWAVIGFTGGYAIDRRWSHKGLLFAILGPLLAFDVILLPFGKITPILMMNDLARLAGWSAGLLIQQDVFGMLLSQEPPSERPIGSEASRPAEAAASPVGRVI
ncbi:MAG: hypothetical protein JWN27_802 [Candidatus Eremiobacteraeota bacterium]|nr:hypothetical protein [Candidatus Eremiobacteraeota bacterium]